jgi:hypothetical protein
MGVPLNFALQWTESSRFSPVSMATALAAAPGQWAWRWGHDLRLSWP